MSRHDHLKEPLEALLRDADVVAHVQRDPVRFPRRYTDPIDQEVAGVIAGMLAYGRVSLFGPVIDALLSHADGHGGPAQWALAFNTDHAAEISDLRYRWNRAPDFALLVGSIGGVLRQTGRLGAAFEHDFAETGAMAPALTAFIDRLRQSAIDTASSLGLSANAYRDLPRGTRTFFASPRDGSACKRWNMVMRWMIRPDDGVDLGRWAIPAKALVLPLDTHTHRLSRMLGLTDRKDASWRTAEEVTQALRTLDPIDPVRFDFALAHLGISGQCQNRYVPDTCEGCPLFGVCAIARTG